MRFAVITAVLRRHPPPHPHPAGCPVAAGTTTCLQAPPGACAHAPLQASVVARAREVLQVLSGGAAGGAAKYEMQLSLTSGLSTRWGGPRWVPYTPLPHIILITGSSAMPGVGY